MHCQRSQEGSRTDWLPRLSWRTNRHSGNRRWLRPCSRRLGPDWGRYLVRVLWRSGPGQRIASTGSRRCCSRAGPITSRSTRRGRLLSTAKLIPHSRRGPGTGRILPFRFMPLLLKVIRLASFESLRLNLGTGDTVQSELVSADTSWARIEGEAVREGGYSLGIDLGQNAAMSGAAAWYPESGSARWLLRVPRAAFPGRARPCGWRRESLPKPSPGRRPDSRRSARV